MPVNLFPADLFRPERVNLAHEILIRLSLSAPCGFIMAMEPLDYRCQTLGSMCQNPANDAAGPVEDRVLQHVQKVAQRAAGIVGNVGQCIRQPAPIRLAGS